MMSNLSFVIPGFGILLILLVYYFSRPQLSTRSNNTFIQLLGIQSLGLLLDVCAGMMQADFGSFPLWMHYGILTAYYMLFAARILWFYLFTVDLLQVDLQARTTRLILSLAIFAVAEISVLLSFRTGAIFYIKDGVYQIGNDYNILYGCFLFYVMLSFLLLFFNYDRLERYQIVSIVAYNSILLLGNLIHFLFPQYLVMNTFSLMAIIIIYLTFQNPDLFRSDRGPSFNSTAFRFMLEEVGTAKNYRILGFVLRNYADEREIYGYHQMDQGIGLISKFIKDLCPGDTVFYLRNGCFAVMGNTRMDWDTIRRKIYERFQKPWNADGADLFLTITFVRISSQSKDHDSETIINRLLSAFNEAQKKYSVDDILIDLDEIHDVDRQVDVKRALDKAIETDNVEIFLQPLIECKSKKMIGAEVLARIRNEEGRIIPPGVFIEIAEQNGQINRLGTQVLEKACRFISEGNLEKTGLRWLNVNLSPIQCMNRDLARQFRDILNRFQVNPEEVHLEITEASMVDFTILEKQIQSLRASGFQFALDDYGSGYSNLTRVKHYPFINIKLDLEVVWDYFREKDVLLPALVKAFKQLNFTVTAEGIETREMEEALSSIGCDYLQGYYYSKPLPVPEFMAKYTVSDLTKPVKKSETAEVRAFS